MPQGFEQEFAEPLVIEGAHFKHENASRSAFRKLFGDNPVLLTRNVEFQSRAGTKPEAVNSTFGAWMDTLSEKESIPYVFEFCNGDLCPKIESSFGIPDFLKASSMILYLNAGKAANGVAFHQHWQTWGLLLAGQKTWYVSPPGKTPRHPHRYSDESTLSTLATARGGLLRCLQEEGEIVFLPKDWWHATFNKADWNLAIGGQGRIEGGIYDAARSLDGTKLKKMSKEENGICWR